jgi:hypothetical protein
VNSSEPPRDNDRDDRTEDREHDRLPAGEDRQEHATRPDPEAPGLYVDDETSAEVPEPNEPG